MMQYRSRLCHARAKGECIRNGDWYNIIRGGTLKHAKPAKFVLSVSLQLGELSTNQMCGMKLWTELA